MRSRRVCSRTVVEEEVRLMDMVCGFGFWIVMGLSSDGHGDSKIWFCTLLLIPLDLLGHFKRKSFDHKEWVQSVGKFGVFAGNPKLKIWRDRMKPAFMSVEKTTMAAHFGLNQHRTEPQLQRRINFIHLHSSF